MENETLKLIQITPGTIFYDGFARTGEPLWLEERNIPNPTSVNWEGVVLTNEEKNAKGDMFLEFVNKKRKIIMNWQFLTQEEYRSLLSVLSVDFNSGSQNILYYEIQAPNPNTAAYETEGSSTPQPKLDTMIGYLEGKYAGKVTILGNANGKIPYTVGYEDVTVVFNER